MQANIGQQDYLVVKYDEEKDNLSEWLQQGHELGTQVPGRINEDVGIKVILFFRERK